MLKTARLRRIAVLTLLFGAGISPAATGATAELVMVSDWRSPLGLRVSKYQPVMDGIPVHGRHLAQLTDASGKVLLQSGTADSVIARIRTGALMVADKHPARMENGHTQHPFKATASNAVWQLRNDRLHPAYLDREINLGNKAEPVAVERLKDAISNQVLERRTLLIAAAPQGYHVFVRGDGRPELSPYGHTWPHPGGEADGWLPTTAIPQQTVSQASVQDALDDPWLEDTATETVGNNVIAFHNSLIESDGVVGEIFESPAWGPLPQPGDGDFAATANSSGTDFVYSYDPSLAGSEYFQVPGESQPEPDPDDESLNAKIVQAFFGANWLHDFFYRAGFDETAGNMQADNFGRGGEGNDPLIIHSGYPTTFAMSLPDGESPVLALGLNHFSASQRDASMDFSILAHEWSHILIGRTAGTSLSGLTNQQGRAVNEGMADYIGLLTGIAAGDDMHGAFAIGQYFNIDYEHLDGLPPAAGVPADPMYYGIRRYPYSMDFDRNPLLFSNLVEQPSLPFYDWKGRGPILHEIHTAGEIFAQALFQCFGRMVAANPDEDFDTLRLRKAQYLVAALMMFPEDPTFLEARNALLGVIREIDTNDYGACRAGFAERGMGAGAVGPDRSVEVFDVAENGFLDQDEKLKLLTAEIEQNDGTCAGCSENEVGVDLHVGVRNSGLITSNGIAITIAADVSDAVTFPEGDTINVDSLDPEQEELLVVPLVIDPERLPQRSGAPLLAFSVTASIDNAGTESGDLLDSEKTLTWLGGPEPTRRDGGGMLGWLLIPGLLLALAISRRREQPG